VDNMCAKVDIKTLPKVLDTISNIYLQSITLNVVDGTEAVTFFNQTYSPGVYFQAENFALWDLFNGSVTVQVDPTAGVMVEGSLAPVSLLGGDLVLSGAPTATDPLYLHLDLTTNLTYDDTPFQVSGGIDLLGEYVAAAVSVSDAGISIFANASLLDDHFDFYLNFTGEGSISKPTDFTLNTTLTSTVLDWISASLPGMLNSSKVDTDQDYADAKSSITAQLANLTSLKEQIANLTAEDTKALTPAEKSLVNAQSNLEDTKSNVDQVKKQIKSKQEQVDALKWKQLWKEASLEAQIATLTTAKATADAALTSAILAVQAAEKLVNGTAELDPKLVALQVEYGVLKALYNAELDMLSVSQTMSDGRWSLDSIQPRRVQAVWVVLGDQDGRAGDPAHEGHVLWHSSGFHR